MEAFSLIQKEGEKKGRRGTTNAERQGVAVHEIEKKGRAIASNLSSSTRPRRKLSQQQKKKGE